jgi:hypothetical protein
VPNARSCESAVRIAGNRIAYVHDLGNRGRMLATIDLAGTARQDIARLDMFPPNAAFDFDGTRLAWSQVRCRDNAVFVRDAADASAPDAAVTCPINVGTPRLARDNTIHGPLSCPKGCRSLSGSGQGMTVFAPRWLHVWRKTRNNIVYAPYRPFSLKPGGKTVLKLPTTANQRRLIRKKRRVNIRLKINAQNVYLPRIVRDVHAR